MNKPQRPIGKSWLTMGCAVLLGWLGNAIPAGGAQFRASAVKVDITPDQTVWLAGYAPRQSTGVHDRIFHRIVAMDDGSTQFFLISTDVAAFSVSVYDDVMKELQAQTGIKPLQVWWTVTHTHSAPEVGPPGLPAVFMAERYHHPPNTEYSMWFERRLIEGIQQARAALQPARLGIGWGISFANINRRARNEEGPAFLGMNPDGPMDRRIGVLRLEKADGTLLALIANYAMHGTVLGPQNTLVSGDAPGIVADYVEEKLGAPMLYINGAAGNLAPIYSVCPDFESGHLEQFQRLLGDKIIEANRRVGSTTLDVRLSLGQQIVEIPRKPGIGWAPDLGEYTRTTQTGESVVRLPIRFLQINGDIAVWAAPIELFNEVSTEIRNRSPFPDTLYFGYCNGWLGYMPTKPAFAQGGYEPKVSPYTPQAADDLIQAVAHRLQEQKDK